MNEGVITADGPTRTILADEELMRANRLEFPYGFKPDYVAGRT
jgi:cobalt/nickel transport system ATP-binding protein